MAAVSLAPDPGSGNGQAEPNGGGSPRRPSDRTGLADRLDHANIEVLRIARGTLVRVIAMLR